MAASSPDAGVRRLTRLLDLVQNMQRAIRQSGADNDTVVHFDDDGRAEERGSASGEPVSQGMFARSDKLFRLLGLLNEELMGRQPMSDQ